MPGSILVVEDNRVDARNLSQALLGGGFRVSIATTAHAALEELATSRFECVLLDKVLPDMDGLECLGIIRIRHPHVPVIIVTGHGSEDAVTQALRLEAADYLKKDGLWVGDVVERVCEGQRRWQLKHVGAAPVAQATMGTAARSAPTDEVRERYQRAGIIGDSEGMQQALRRAESAANSNARVLLRGETGTGKEVFARAIHDNGPRKRAPLVAVNCGGLAESLLEDDLFGHVAGAYTGAQSRRRGWFEEADQGTLFLDEIESASPRLQSALLRVLEDGVVLPLGGERTSAKKIDVRVIAATQCDLSALAEAGRFRSDLFYRLSVLTIQLPPLRERVEDIEPLVRHFIRVVAASAGGDELRYTPAAIERLQQDRWIGNVRELRNVIEALVASLEPGSVITPRELDPLLPRPAAANPRSLEGRALTSPELCASLARHHGFVKHVAEELGVSTKTVERHMKKFDLDWRSFRKGGQKSSPSPTDR